MHYVINVLAAAASIALLAGCQSSAIVAINKTLNVKTRLIINTLNE